MDSPSSSNSKVEKPLSIDKAAFLLLRVRKVFKKKIAIKKEKHSSNQDIVFAKGEGIIPSKSKKQRGVPPLIRSRTVPAIIVPFSILQAQLVKASGGCGGGSGNSGGGSSNSPSSSNTPGTSFSPSSSNQIQSKSDFSTPGLDFVQFLTGSGSPSSSIAGTPPSRRDTHCLGLSNPSIYHDFPSVEASSWNVNLNSAGNISSCSTSNISPLSGDSIILANNTGSSTTSIIPHSVYYHHGSLSATNSIGTVPVSSSSTSSSNKAFSRFARLLNSQSPKSSQNQQFASQNQKYQGTGPVSNDATFNIATPRLLRRRRSLEDEDLSNCRPRAVSIDSLIKNQFLAPPSASDGNTGRSLSPKRFSTSSAGPSLGGGKQDQKFQEGFIGAVENGNVSKVKNLLESSDVDVNGLTSDGLTVLDLAVIQRNRPMVKLLLTNGATENQYWRKESLSDQLTRMVAESEKKSEDLMAKILKCSTFGNLTPSQLKELEKEFHQWEKRYKKFRKMKSEYTQIRPPDPPTKVTLDVIGPCSVKVKLQENESDPNSICTKYKIEWSNSEEFSKEDPSTRFMEIYDLRRMETILNDLKKGKRLYFRVAFGNSMGFGNYIRTHPTSVIPSSWKEEKNGKYIGKASIFDEIFKEVYESRPEDAAEIRSCQPLSTVTVTGGPLPPSSSFSSNFTSNNSTTKQKNQKIISIKQLFSAAPKFQKNFKRGVFLSCVMYSEDKLLVTTEEFLPTIEIDETFPSTIHNDFHWLLKVACTWEDVKSLKQDIEKSGSASTFHFRLKLLQAASSMQNALGIGDLGRLYYKTIRDKTNSVVLISTINYVRSTKMISSLNVRWIPLSKMNNRKINNDISDILINSIQEQILYHQVSNIPLGKGLYLGYLKLASSVDLLRIIVPEKTPNILPHAKIRDNPHVSGEEWEVIQRMGNSKSTESLTNVEANNNYEAAFLQQMNNGLISIEINDELIVNNNESLLENNLIDTNQRKNINESDTEIAEQSSEQKSENPSRIQCSTSLIPSSTFPSGRIDAAPISNAESSTTTLYNSEWSDAQELFRSQLSSALRKLFAFLEVDEESSLTHRIYNTEVIEVNSNVSLIIILPALENVCVVVGQSDKLIQRTDLLSLPIQVFEMIHFLTYQKEFITRYGRLSTILEVDTILAQHNQRVAFSGEEVSKAKQRLNQLQEFQSHLDSTWKCSRWVIDLVTNARDRNLVSSSVRNLLDQIDGTTAKAGISEENSSFEDNVRIRKGNGDIQLIGLHSKSDQSLRLGGNLSGSGIKFSRSENQLATIGGNNSDDGSTDKNEKDTEGTSQYLLIHPTHPAGGRKISMPVQCMMGEQGSTSSAEKNKIVEKLTFSPKIYSNHSQSDTTISTNNATSIRQCQQLQNDAISSTSLHNLYRHSSSTQITIPSLIISTEPCSTVSHTTSQPSIEPNYPPSSPIPVGNVRASPIPPHLKAAVGGQSSRPKGEPPPVPPRRNIPSTTIPFSLNTEFTTPSPPKSCSSSASSHSSYVCKEVEIGSPLTRSTQVTGILQIYPAYECGLTKGTSVKIQINNTTTTSQVVDLVVNQLNNEVEAKHGKKVDESSSAKSKDDFVLVSVIGGRERCLRPDFKPILLQEPWKDAKLFVRLRNDVTAAISLNNQLS